MNKVVDCNSINNNEPSTDQLFSYIRGEASKSVSERIEQWIQEDIGHEQTLMQIARIFFSQQTRERIESRDPYSAFEQFQVRLRKKKTRLFLYQYMKYVAIVLLMITTSVTTLYFAGNNNDVQQEKEVPQMVTMCSSAGMRTKLTLPDGSTVFMNSGTTISYPVHFDVDIRKVTLDGEAYFQVAHNPDCPFVVSLNEDKVKLEVLGTEFNVESYKKDEVIHTSLVNGSVKLYVQFSTGREIQQVLKPSEKAVYEKQSQQLTIRQVNTMYDTAWMDGVLMFKETPLPEVLRRLSHFYNVSFDVKDRVINSYCFTGTFVNRQLSQILDYLQISSSISYNIIRAVDDDSHGIKRDKVVLRKK